jgi:hypothetical protein
MITAAMAMTVYALICIAGERQPHPGIGKPLPEQCMSIAEHALKRDFLIRCKP